MGYEMYNFMDKQQDSQYPNWESANPNLNTFLNAINKSQPIIKSQYELVMSRWPRTLFFAKGLTIPGLATQTITINHAGFDIQVPAFVKYETTEIQFTIIADKEGYHYYDWRNMVLQSAHPLIAGDTRSMIGKDENDSGEDFLDVKLRNKPDDKIYHHWIVHNFRPTKIGDIDLGQDDASFVEFEVTGTFTHITYDCGERELSENDKNMAEDIQWQDDFTFYGQDDKEDDSTETPDEEDEPEWEDEGQPDTDPTPDPQPQYPEPPKPTPLDIMSAEDSLTTTDTTESFSSSANDARFEDGSKVSDQTINDAKDCMDEMEQAKKEYEEKMKEIEKMQPDPNYKGADTWGSEDIASTDTPSQEQLDKRAEEEKKNFEDLSIDGKIAKDIGEANPNASEEEIMSEIRKKLDEKSPGYYDTPAELQKDAEAAYKEYMDAKDKAEEAAPFDKISSVISDERPCKSQAQAEAYQKAMNDYMQKCKDAQNKYKTKKASNESGGNK